MNEKGSEGRNNEDEHEMTTMLNKSLKIIFFYSNNYLRNA